MNEKWQKGASNAGKHSNDDTPDDEKRNEVEQEGSQPKKAKH